MAIKKEEAQNAADRAAQQGLGLAQEGNRKSEEAADATRRFGEESRRAFDATAEEGRRTMQSAGQAAGEEGKRTADAAAEATRNVAQFSRDQAQRTADAAQQSVHQAASVLGASAKSYGELAELSRGDAEAVMQSSARIARGLQEMGWEVARFSQDTLRCGLRTASDMMHCRSLEDMVEAQSSFVRETMDRALDQQARMLRLSRAAAEEAERAISARVKEHSQQLQQMRSQ